MTEVEISRLLAELAQTAQTLNRESDSINALIERFEETLRKLNVGLEVWVTDPSLRREHWTEENDEGEVVERGTREDELGFAKYPDEWRLVIRTAAYREHPDGRWELVNTGHYTPLLKYMPLLQASRDIRIKALALFPALLKELKREADAALRAIEDAKKFVR